MILQYLDLTTAHITSETADKLEAYADGLGHAWPAMTVATYDYGYFVTVPDPVHYSEQEWGTLPFDLATVLKFAYDRNANLIRFDADGGVMTGLPIYDWSK